MMSTACNQPGQPERADLIIAGRKNPGLKQIRALPKRPERKRTGLAPVEGLRLVTEALAFPGLVRQLVVAPELLKSLHGWGLVQDQKARGAPVLSLGTEAFERISRRSGPQGIAAVIAQRWNHLNQVTLSPGDCWIALAAMQDPGNLGTILRSCGATGCRGVFLLDRTTDPYDPTALRASMGAIFSQRLVRTSFQIFAEWIHLHRYPVIGTSDAAALSYRNVEYSSPVVLLLGSERLGLSPEQQALCERVVYIPMNGCCASLTVAIATAVVLYEILDQRARPRIN